MQLFADVDQWVVNLDIGTQATVWICLLPIIPVLYWCWRRRRRHKPWYFWPLPLVLPVIIIAAAAGVNNYYGFYTRFGDLIDDYPFPTTGSSALAATSGSFPQGVSVQVAINGSASGVGPHPAFIWLPPQYFEKPTLDFPVVYLVAGSPGTFTDWSLGGNATTTALTSAKNGNPAIVVSVSVSDSELADTECVNGVQGNWQTYLTIDVPKYVDENVRTLKGAKNQAIAGLSMGGYCAQAAALRNPSAFGYFGNFSGATVPTYSSMSDLFGNVPNLDHVVDTYSSDWIANNQPQSHSVEGQLLTGQQDDPSLIADQQQFVALASGKGMDVTFNNSIPGDHSFYFWTTTLKEWLPWALERMGKPAP